ncbi:nitroreductase family protein [Klenkia sp. LSe6-5]|uniref:Nitroreductase family protein n=1 Tax=Klenkia sesuvii TaxID=3103137 RepID=A0ABU8DVT9_9ACTN
MITEPELPEPELPGPVELARLADVEAAADAALLAPSVHNTQPWLLVLNRDRIDVRADRSRQLHVLDPAGRDLLISVGAAVLNARAELAARGHGVRVERFPHAGDPDLAAVLTLVDALPDPTLARLAAHVRSRRTNRRGYTADPVPPTVLDRAIAAAADEDTLVVPVLTEDQHRTVARLAQTADAEQNADPAYRHEIRTWTNRDAHLGDGVPPTAVPRVDGGAEDDVPLRDFDTRGQGALPSATHAGRTGALLVLASHADDERAWLRTGEAMERVLLELAADGWAAGPLSQITEVAHTRAALRRELCWDAHPQLLLRVGRAVPTTGSPRRGRDEVVHGSTRPGPGPAQRLPASPTGWPAAGAARAAQEVPGHRVPVPDGRGGTTWV